MESDCSLPSSQQPATCPCHRQDQSGTHHLIPFKINCNILPSVSGSSKWSVSVRHLHKIIYASLLYPVSLLWHFKIIEQRWRNSRSRPIFGLCQNLFVTSVRSTAVPLTAVFFFFLDPPTSAKKAFRRWRQPFKAYWSCDAPTGLTFNNCRLCPHCICVFCIYLRTNSD